MKIDSPTFVSETTFISSSVVFSSGSQKFGNTSDDIHQFTGSQSTTLTGSFGSLDTNKINIGDNHYISSTGGAPSNDLHIKLHQGQNQFLVTYLD